MWMMMTRRSGRQKHAWYSDLETIYLVGTRYIPELNYGLQANRNNRKKGCVFIWACVSNSTIRYTDVGRSLGVTREVQALRYASNENRQSPSWKFPWGSVVVGWGGDELRQAICDTDGGSCATESQTCAKDTFSYFQCVCLMNEISAMQETSVMLSMLHTGGPKSTQHLASCILVSSVNPFSCFYPIKHGIYNQEQWEIHTILHSASSNNNPDTDCMINDTTIHG